MRVCYFTDSFLPYLSGVTFVVMNQGNELVRRGHGVAVFSPKPKFWRNCEDRPDELHPDIEMHRVPMSFPTRSRPNLRVTVPTFLSSLRHVRRFRPDIVHVHTEWGCGWEGLLAARALRIPVVGTFHTFFADPGYLKQFHLPNYRATRAVMWRYSVTYYNRCDALICPSQSARNNLLSKHVRKNPTTISNGIIEPEVKSDDAIRVLRERYGVRGSPVFIYVGRVSVEKSLEVVLQAFKKVLSGCPESQLVIVGDGPTDDALDAEAERLGISSAVLRTGAIDHDVLVSESIPRLGDVFVTASDTENQPLSLMEAMSFGLPLVAADAKGNPELLEDGRNGFLFPPGDADTMAAKMQRFVDTPALAASMGRESDTLIRPHYVPNVVDRLEDLYTDTVHEYKHKRRRSLRRWSSGE